jgi:hypothetical protein
VPATNHLYYIISGISNISFHNHQPDETTKQYIAPVVCELARLRRPKKGYKVTMCGYDLSPAGI